MADAPSLTLHVQASLTHAVQLARLIEEEDWGGEKPIVYDDQEEMAAGVIPAPAVSRLLCVRQAKLKKNAPIKAADCSAAPDRN